MANDEHLLTETEVITQLKAMVEDFEGGMKQAAEHFEVSQAMMYYVVHGDRKLTPKILSKLGLEAVPQEPLYRKVNGG